MVKEVSVTPTAPGEARIAYWIEDQQGKVVGKNARVEAVTEGENAAP
jgi:beta-mannosidase